MYNFKIIYFRLTLLFFVLLFCSCHTKKHYLTTIKAQNIEITDTLTSNDTLSNFIAPYRDRINAELNQVLAYSVSEYSKNDGELNSALGNLLADAVYQEANPIFNARTGNTIDFVLLNHGGIRSVLPKGDVSPRTAYSLMPFENYAVVIELTGETVNQLIQYLVKEKRAHPISGLQLVVSENYELISATINNQPITPDASYFVATSDYLSNGGDNMTFFQQNKGFTNLDYKIRNILIDYFKKNDTINPVSDNRFIIKNNAQ